MYTYRQEKLNERVFIFLYGCAMHDAILQRAFISEEKRWVAEVKEAQATVKSYIDRVIGGEFSEESGKEAHEQAFLETANQVCKDINAAKTRAPGSAVFSFGNAQKLINMTVKHVYAHTYSAPSLRKCFRHCHCPMDSIMLARVWGDYGQAFGTQKRRSDLGLGDVFKDSWGDEGVVNKEQPLLTKLPDRYAKFQTAIRELINNEDGDCFPVEFDYQVWKNEEKET